MKSESTASAAPTLPASLPARVGHEMLGLFVTVIFCAFEFLVFLTELRPSRLFRRKSPGNR